MSATGLETFDTTLQKTNEWLGELMEELHWDDRRRAYRGLKAVLHALRDRLSVEEASHLAAQLPLLVRGFYYEGWHPADKPLKERSREQFLAHVTQELNRDPGVDPGRLCRAVFELLERHLTGGEINDVKQSLPSGIRELWP